MGWLLAPTPWMHLRGPPVHREAEVQGCSQQLQGHPGMGSQGEAVTAPQGTPPGALGVQFWGRPGTWALDLSAAQARSNSQQQLS